MSLRVDVMIHGGGGVFWCQRTQGEELWRGWVPPAWTGMVSLCDDAETDTDRPTEGRSQCLEDEYYISAVLLSVFSFAEVIAVILFSVCCWQCCMAY